MTRSYRHLIPCLTLGLTMLAASVAANEEPKRIAITFDDAPRPAGASMPLATRTEMLIDALSRSDTVATFFATTSNLENRRQEGHERLSRYAEAGHLIANHSHTHRSANRIPAQAFLADLAKANDVLSQFPNYRPLFRFPFLHEGRTIEKRDAIRAGLNDIGLANGYVTIDNYDWYLQHLFSEAVRQNRTIDLDAWRQTYLDVLMAAIDFYDDLAVSTLNRSPVHVLLLHENDLAALFIDDLIAALEHQGWKIVSTDEAYADPIAQVVPDTLVLGQGRVAAIAASDGAPFVDLIHPWENEAVLRALLVQRGLIGLAEGAYLSQPTPGLTPEIFAPDIISLPDRYEFGITFSADGREVFFGVADNDKGEIHSARYVDAEWQPSSVLLRNADFPYADPHLSRDATRLYFISRRPVPDHPNNGSDLWYQRRSANGWSDPIHLGTEINSKYDEFYTSITHEDQLVFASNRDGSTPTDFNLYLSERRNGRWSRGELLPGKINTKAYEADPFIAPDGSYIVFSTTRVRGQGRDLFVSFRRTDNTWSKGVSLGPRINTDAIEFCPYVTRDGRFLFYTSNEDIVWVDAAVIDLAREQLDNSEN